MTRTFKLFLRWACLVVLCTCLAVAGVVFFAGSRQTHELRRRFDDIRAGTPWTEHLEWFRAQENIDDALKNEILTHWRGDPEYASAIVDLARGVCASQRSSSWTQFFRRLVREHLNHDWGRVAKQGKMVDFIMRCMYAMEDDVESHSLWLDYVERHASDLLKRAAIVHILRRREEGVERERGVLARAAESSYLPLSVKALQAMAQLRYRECIVPARRILARPEAEHRLRTAAAAALVMLGDHTSHQRVKAYVAELKGRFVDKGTSTELGDPHFARFELDELIEAMVNAPVPTVWVEEMEKLAGLKCLYLRKRMAELLWRTPDRAFMKIAQLLVKDNDAAVRARAKDAVGAIENSMPETWDFLKEDPARGGQTDGS